MSLIKYLKVKLIQIQPLENNLNVGKADLEKPDICEFPDLVSFIHFIHVFMLC